MTSNPKRLLAACAASGALLFVGSSAAQAYGGWSSDGGSFGSGQASSYINPDTGAATANPDVDPNSSCFRPDQYDMQRFSDPTTASRNVHNDACFLKDGLKVDGPASFESKGVGFISACPDPDGAGPKVAVLSDRNGDGRNDLCFQSGYQMKGVAGDLEFHARMNNNTGMAGTQTVTWCSDADRDGCSDEWDKSTIRIDWSADGTATYSSDRDGYSRSW